MCNSVISDCSYNLWVVNKTNYQSERRLQYSKHGTVCFLTGQSCYTRTAEISCSVFPRRSSKEWIAHVHFCFQLSHKTQAFKSGDCGGQSSAYELFPKDSSIVSIELLVVCAVALSHIKFVSDFLPQPVDGGRVTISFSHKVQNLYFCEKHGPIYSPRTNCTPISNF
jgi:hypothetical protein